MATQRRKPAGKPKTAPKPAFVPPRIDPPKRWSRANIGGMAILAAIVAVIAVVVAFMEKT